MERQIIIPYSPRNWAKELHNSLKRWIVLVLHRRAGKTTAVLNHLQRDCLKVPKSQYAYIGPTYKQSKRIAWDIIKSISFQIPKIGYNEAELTVKYPNGSKLFLAGSENVDSLRGIPLWGGCQDEASLQPSNLFSEVISKCLADHLGYWIWLGTPKGKNEFFRTYQNALNNPDWTCLFKTIDDSLRDEQGETIRNLGQALQDDKKLVQQGLMTEDEFYQEWYCSFDASIKGAYYAGEISRLRQENRFRILPHSPYHKVYDVWDLGVGQQLAIGFYQRIDGEMRMIDYWEGSNTDGIPQAIKALIEKPYIYGKHFAPHDIETTDISTGKSRKDTAKTLGWNFVVLPKLLVDDGIHAGKLMFNHLFVDSNKCSLWLDAISQYHQEWDDKRGMFLEKPYHDWTSHPADVHRYAAIAENMMIENINDFQKIMKNNENNFIANPYK